jgi:uracil-DNA glycosylase
MVDRRRTTRLVFSNPASAHVRVVQDAVLEHAGPDNARVLTAEPAAPGDSYLLQFTDRSGELLTRSARVLSSTPVVRNNVVSYRLELAVAYPDPIAGPALA